MVSLEGPFRRRAVSAFLLTAALAGALTFAPGASARPKIFTGLPAGTVLAYSSYFGSDGVIDTVNAVTTDPAGNVYLAGAAQAPETFPTTPGVVQPAPAGSSDAFVAKFDPAGRLLYSTLFGGTGGDTAVTLDVTADGEVVMAGTTLSQDLPVTPGALQSEFRGVIEDCEFACSGDAFVARLSADASELVYATYLGGSLNEVASSLVIDDTGDATIAGSTTSPDFPVTQNAYDTDYADPTCFDQCDADSFVAQLNTAGTQLRFATYFGGTSWDSPAGMDVDEDGDIYIAGATRSVDLDTTDGSYQPEKNGNADFDFSPFVASFDADASNLNYATYLGGAPEEQATAVSVEPDGTAWVAGWAAGRALATTGDALQQAPAGQGDGFASALSADGTTLEYSTRFGGSRFDSMRGIEAGQGTVVTVYGGTASTDLPTRRALQRVSGGLDDLFYMRFQPGQPSPVFSTYVGGRGFESATDLAIHELDTAYLVGQTESNNLPLAGRFHSNDLGGSDGFLMRVDPGRTQSQRVDADGFAARRIRTSVVESSFRWHNATRTSHRVADLDTEMFATRVRAGSDYHFTFPSGRFVVEDLRTGASQRIAVAPGAAWGDEAGTIELAWARFPLGEPFVFDVQMKRGDGVYETLFDGTTLAEATLTEPEVSYRFRARVRNVDTGETSRWSPPALLGPGG